MKKLITLAIMLILTLVLFAIPASAAGTLNINIQGTTIEATVVDDFSSYEAKTVGAFEYDGEKLTALVNSPYTEDYALELANNELTKGAKFVGLKVTSEIDDFVYFSFQGRGEGADSYFLTKDGVGDPILLVSKTGSAQAAVLPETRYNGRYCIELPELFDGYVIIPASRLAVLAQTDIGSTWTADSLYTTLGIYMESPSAGDNVIFDDVFVGSATLPVLVEETAAPTAEPTATPEATATATVKPTTATSAAATIAPTPVAAATPGNTWLVIAIVAGVLVIAGVVFFVVKKKAVK